MLEQSGSKPGTGSSGLRPQRKWRTGVNFIRTAAANIKNFYESRRVSSTEADRPTALAASDRVSLYWEGQFEKNRADPSLWTNNDLVAPHIYRLISDGSEEHWLPWFFHQYLNDEVVFKKSLSVCCGDGAHELAIAKTGKVQFIRGFDISEGAIAQANATFEKAAIPQEHYAFDVADADNLQLDDRFDLILSTGGLHHVTNLEGLLSKLSTMFSPDGYFVAVEYVGPNRFQWTERQVRIINAILRRLDTHFLRDHTRIDLSPPKIADMMATDPSEAVRSEDVLRLLDRYFTIEYLRNFNGTIMHPLYHLLDAGRTNANQAEFDSVLRMILCFENILVRENVLRSDFVFAICRSKRTTEDRDPSQERGGRKKRRFIGRIDSFDGKSISGWAANVKTPTTPIRADVYINDRLEGSVTCDGFRQDLKEAGHGDGRKAFGLALDSRPASPAGRMAKLVVAGSRQVLATRVCDAP